MTHTIFTTQTKIRFKHTDPAGIVFFPQFVAMMNDSTEDLMEQMGYGFAPMHQKGVGMPIVNVTVDFKKPAYLGQIITKHAEFSKIGTRSYTVHHWYEYGGDILVDGTQTCVFVAKQVDGTFQSVPIPDELRFAMMDYLKADS